MIHRILFAGSSTVLSDYREVDLGSYLQAEIAKEEKSNENPPEVALDLDDHDDNGDYDPHDLEFDTEIALLRKYRYYRAAESREQKLHNGYRLDYGWKGQTTSRTQWGRHSRRIDQRRKRPDHFREANGLTKEELQAMTPDQRQHGVARAIQLAKGA